MTVLELVFNVVNLQTLTPGGVNSSGGGFLARVLGLGVGAAALAAAPTPNPKTLAKKPPPLEFTPPGVRVWR